MLSRIINNNTINKLLQFEASDASAAYTVTELFSDLKKGIWTELNTHKPIDMYRRNLQKIYGQKLIDLVKPVDKSTPVVMTGRGSSSMAASPVNLNDGLSIIKGQVKNLIAEIRIALPLINDANSKLHLQDVMERLKDGLDPKI